MEGKPEKNRNKTAFICSLAASICFYISAIIGIAVTDNSSWVVNLCLGSAFLCISTVYLNKYKTKDNDKDNDKDNKDNKDNKDK